jgi:hypothetical protein
MESAHGPLARKTLRTPGRETARGRKTARGLLALGASRAPGRNLGLGRERLIPPGLKLGSLSVNRPSQSDGRTRFLAEQNWLRIRRVEL